MNDFNLWEKVRLPPELLARLDAMIRRVRILQLARGLLATLGVALASILVVMGVDAALVITSDAVRWGLSLAGLALTLLTLPMDHIDKIVLKVRDKSAGPEAQHVIFLSADAFGVLPPVSVLTPAAFA